MCVYGSFPVDESLGGDDDPAVCAGRTDDWESSFVAKSTGWEDGDDDNNLFIIYLLFLLLHQSWRASKKQ